MGLDAVAGLSTLLFVVMGFAVGLRLLLLARRTGEIPELALGAGLFLIVGLGYPLLLMAIRAPGVPLEPARWLAGIATVFMNAGWSSICLFTWRVFRPDTGWARGLTAGCVLALALITVGRFADFASATERLDFYLSSRSLLATQGFALAVYVWTGTEALLCHARLKRQLALGLIEPVVVNRVLLWAWVTVFCFLSVLPGFATSLLGVQLAYAKQSELLSSLAGLACGGTLYLAFFPPHFYLRRIEGATA